MIGYAFCGSHCTLSASLRQLEAICAAGRDVLPILSESVWTTDTRFWQAADFRARIEAITGRSAVHTIVDAEPLGPAIPLESLVIAPCTGNTLAKLANGITDTAVCMAAKAHLALRPTTVDCTRLQRCDVGKFREYCRAAAAQGGLFRSTAAG